MPLIDSPLQYRGKPIGILGKGGHGLTYNLSDLAHLKRGDLVYLSTGDFWLCSHISNFCLSLLLEAAGEPVAHHRSRCIYWMHNVSPSHESSLAFSTGSHLHIQPTSAFLAFSIRHGFAISFSPLYPFISIFHWILIPFSSPYLTNPNLLNCMELCNFTLTSFYCILPFHHSPAF